MLRENKKDSASISQKGVISMRKAEDLDAEYSKRMIEVKVRFGTDNICEGRRIIPKVCWESGVVSIERNDVHDITPGHPVPFDSMTEILPKIEQVLETHGVKVVRKETVKGLYTTIDKI